MSEITYKNKKRLYILAKAICNILNPLLMPVYLILMLVSISNIFVFSTINIQTVFLVFLVLLIFLAPFILFLVLKRFRIIKDYSKSSRKDKVNFVVPTILLYSLIQLFVVNEIPIYFIARIFAAVNLTAIITIAISYFCRINVYTIGLGALVATLNVLGYLGFKGIDIFLIILLLCFGLSGTASMYLRKYNLLQTFVGIIVGYLAMFTLVTL
ncbi:MAG: hypothetical protein R3Y26_00100 [Rikenellaceae bacterium]